MLHKCMQAMSTHLDLFQIANIHCGHFNMLNSTSIGVHALAHNITCAEKLAPGPNTRCGLTFSSIFPGANTWTYEEMSFNARSASFPYKK
jgi:hypothetical protein